VLENNVLREIFRPKKDEASGLFRILQNEELSNLYRPPSIVRIVKYKRFVGLHM
jgi:hypothetical protein